jgi:hypothetical protein
MKRVVSLRALLILTMLLLTGALRAAPVHAGDPPNRLDDERGAGSGVSLAGDLCSAILGPFSLGGIIGCPGMDRRVL